MVMKRASYREAIAWIALNDSAGDNDALDPTRASELVSSVLIADLFDVPMEKVGEDIVRYRKKHSNVRTLESFDLPAAQWCGGKHVNGRACDHCGPIIQSHLDHKAVHGT